MPTIKISDGKTTHTVSTKEEALHLIERYFGKEEDKNMKDILARRIADEYAGILIRKGNGWDGKELKAFIAGVSNTLENIIIDFKANELLTDTEVDELDELLRQSIDTL